MFLVDFVIDWSYTIFYFLRDYPYSFIRNHIFHFFVGIILIALIIQSVTIFNPPAPIIQSDNITIQHPSKISLNEPFLIKLTNLHSNTYYQLSFLDHSYMMRPQETFLANTSTYATHLRLSQSFILDNNSVRLLVYEPYTTTIVGSTTLYIGVS